MSLLRESPDFFVAFFKGAVFAMVAQGFYIGYTRKHPTRELRRREDPPVRDLAVDGPGPLVPVMFR